MRAARFHTYGDADVLQIEEVAEPTPKPHQVQIRVRASSLNAADIGGRQGITRLIHARNLPHIPGYDVAGVVEHCGKGVTAFVPGEPVFALTGLGGGAQADYVCIAQDRVARAPERLDLRDAAAVPLAGLTAIQALLGKASIRNGQRLLVNGAAGGVGSFAVQLGKRFGCHVTGVCRGDKASAVLALGADQVIDYTEQDFAKLAQSWNVVFDAAGNRDLRDVQAVLEPNGVMVATRPPPASVVASRLRLSGPRPRYEFLITKASGHDLALLARLIDAGDLQPLIDRTFALDDIQDAHRYYEAGATRGKVLIEVAGA